MRLQIGGSMSSMVTVRMWARPVRSVLMAASYRLHQGRRSLPCVDRVDRSVGGKAVAGPSGLVMLWRTVRLVRVADAKALVLDLIHADIETTGVPVVVDPSPSGLRDPGKFLLDGRAARAIHHYDGWYVPIELSWFEGAFEMPSINGEAFYWYVFAIPNRSRYRRDHYLICDYLQIREWVLDFTAPLGRDHRDHRNWRADLRVYIGDDAEAEGYFRWGDEPVEQSPDPWRVFELDNVVTLHELALAGQRVGTLGRGGESAAHRRLKLYVAAHPTEFGLTTRARSQVEYAFTTGDRVDVMFENHAPDRTVVEVEIEGEDNICVGIHQAIKYRSLAEVEAGYPLLSSRVGSLVVAYDTQYPKAAELAGRYDVTLRQVDRDLVLASAV